jgi:predicted enzyme related to lactoylglutathione lyase
MGQLTGTGVFFWRDLMTTDQDAALKFYGDLFGWKLNRKFEMDGDEAYYILENNGERFGGMTKLSPEAGSHPYWVSYIRTPDVDATAARAKEIGGSIMFGPEDIPEVGRFAIIADQAGAGFSAMTDKMPEPVADGDDVKAGGVTWNELLTSDVEGSLKFYADLFGYGIEKQEMSGMSYSMLSVDRAGTPTPIAGVFAKPEQMKVSAWMIYFKVDDIDAARKKIEELGGKNIGPVMEVPEVGRMSTAMDSTGGYFSIHEYDKN